MTPDEKKRKFEEDLIEIAVAEYYHWVDEKNEKKPMSVVRSQKDAEMFYDAMRLGVIRGINFATNQYIQSMERFEQQKQQEKKDGRSNTEISK